MRLLAFAVATESGREAGRIVTGIETAPNRTPGRSA
jgi:hypothetical protein